MTDSKHGVLEEVRVLDFGRYIAGPYCACLLSDLGADVIRIEKVAGSEDRKLIPVADDDAGALFLQVNRNKRGLTLNPTKPEGREITRRLVASADVVVANLPAQALEAMGIDYATCQRTGSLQRTYGWLAFGNGGDNPCPGSWDKAEYDTGAFFSRVQHWWTRF